MGKKCKHNRLKRKFIVKGYGIGEYEGYCSQQCKRMIKFKITQADIDAVYPRGRPK
jgi:hypothetical protein